MVGRAAFRDMQVRGFLNPAGWNTYPVTVTAPYTMLTTESRHGRFKHPTQAGGSGSGTPRRLCHRPTGDDGTPNGDLQPIYFHRCFSADAAAAASRP